MAAQIGTAIDRAQAAYDRIAASADVILPFLSPERAAQAPGDVAGGTRATRSAVCSDGSEQLAALKQVEAATAAIETTAGT